MLLVISGRLAVQRGWSDWQADWRSELT